ncbi:MAG: DNA polymerase III subunit beta [Clostridiales Family XIII bacterium]|jgi:DNA polymerase-3 subunit beta|nr:DNA polymerase III subunit beta [Clostridiales Family XIII bacterium]
MKFTCEKETLNYALNIVSKGVSSRTTLPILKGIMISAVQGESQVTFYSSDLDISIKTSTPAFVEDGGEIVVSAKLFADIVREMPAGQILFELKEGNMAFLSGKNSEFDIQGIPSDEFPRIEDKIEGSEISIEKATFKDMIRRTAFAASMEEARGIITGVLCEIGEGAVSLVALDGFRMAITRGTIGAQDPMNVIIASRIIGEIAKIIDDTGEEGGENIEIIAGESKAKFIMGETEAVVRLMEGEFIKYRDILPKENKIKIKVSKSDLIESVKRAQIIVREGKNTFIKFKLEGDSLIVSSRADEGRNKEIIFIEKEGEDLEIGFNGRFVNDVLRVIPDEKIIMEFSTSISPCLIKPEEGDRYEYLILPVRLSSGGV